MVAPTLPSSNAILIDMIGVLPSSPTIHIQFPLYLEVFLHFPKSYLIAMCSHIHPLL